MPGLHKIIDVSGIVLERETSGVSKKCWFFAGMVVVVISVWE